MTDPQIVAAVIAGGLTCLAALIPFFFNIQIRPIPAGSRALKRLLTGNWIGTVTEDGAPADPGAPLGEVTWNFTVRGRKIYADSQLRHTPVPSDSGGYSLNQLDTFKLTGTFLHDRFIKFEYSNVNGNEINFGTEVLHIHDNGKSFTGRYVGYSSDRGVVVSGEIRGVRAPNSP